MIHYRKVKKKIRKGYTDSFKKYLRNNLIVEIKKAKMDLIMNGDRSAKSDDTSRKLVGFILSSIPSV